MTGPNHHHPSPTSPSYNNHHHKPAPPPTPRVQVALDLEVVVLGGQPPVAVKHVAGPAGLVHHLNAGQVPRRAHPTIVVAHTQLAQGVYILGRDLANTMSLQSCRGLGRLRRDMAIHQCNIRQSVKSRVQKHLDWNVRGSNCLPAVRHKNAVQRIATDIALHKPQGQRAAIPCRPSVHVRASSLASMQSLLTDPIKTPN